MTTSAAAIAKRRGGGLAMQPKPGQPGFPLGLIGIEPSQGKPACIHEGDSLLSPLYTVYQALRDKCSTR